MKANRYQRAYLFPCICVFYFLLLVTIVHGAVKIPAEWTPVKSQLIVTNNLNKTEKELIIETDEWKVVFSLFYNGGIYKMYDKVHDPYMLDNLVTDPSGYKYCQGGIFDYDVYLRGEQEFMTTMGRNNNPGRASLEILENTPVRVRIRQICHPRLNNGGGPPSDRYIELDMVEATTDWTFYPTGRVYIKFDAVIPEDWNEILSTGSGGVNPGINAFNDTIIAVNGTDFLNPWITRGDMIESAIGGWGPVEISERINQSKLRLTTVVPSGSNIDFIIRRTNIIDETISMHADGDPGSSPRTSYWQGGSNGVPVWINGTDGDMFRGNTPPLSADYVFVHCTRAPRGFGSLLTFKESLAGWSYAVFNDLTYSGISYTQVARRGWRRFQEYHRHFMAQLGTENAQVLARIKSAADAIPFADDYRNPYAEARVGTLDTGEGISTYGFNVETGAYHIIAENNIAEIVFDAHRSIVFPCAYAQPAVLVSSINAADDQLNIELSQDNGIVFEKLPTSWYNLTTNAESEELGDSNRRLLQLFGSIPVTATGDSAWVLRVRSNSTGIDRKAEYIPYKIQLNQNYPNPFNPTTTIRYSLGKSTPIKLTIYNLLGQRIKTLVDGRQNAGEYSVVWDPADEGNNPVSSGIYFYKLETDCNIFQNKMVLLR